MRKLITRNEYVASNLRYYADQKEAYSYEHWCFVKEINGKIIFNNYNYSSTTIKHQLKVRSLLSELDVKIDHYVYLYSSLSPESFKKNALRHYYEQAIEMIVQNNTKRVRKKTKECNIEMIKEIKETIKELRQSGAEFSKVQIYDIYRNYKKNRSYKENVIQFMKQYKNKVFIDKQNERWVVSNTDREYNLITLKHLNDDGYRKYTGHHDIIRDYNYCPLSNALST